VAPPGCGSAVLSYVWGVNLDQHKLLATNASITELKHDGARTRAACNMPPLTEKIPLGG